jgi:hypothetical protein
MEIGIAATVLVIAVLAGVAFAVVRGLRLWRDVKRSSSTFGAELARITAASLEIERHMAQAEAASGRLKVASDRLATSRARLDLQVAALREARAQMRRTFWFVPGI